MEVEVVNRQRFRRVATGPLRRFAEGLAQAAGGSGCRSMTVCLVSDVAMRALNRRWRGRDRSTDVLSFEGSSQPGPGGHGHLGDIVISIPTAARQARDAGHSLPREIRVLLLHGYLHLLGYDHETDDGAMRRLERRIERRVLPRGKA